MLEQAAVSSRKKRDGGLLLPPKLVDLVLPAFWGGVECLSDDGLCLSDGDWLLWLLPILKREGFENFEK